MIGIIEHCFRHQRRRAHAFESRYGPGAFLRTMHAGGIELDDPVGVREPSKADAVVEWIELHDIYAGDYRIKHVSTLRHHRERLLPRGYIPAVFETLKS